MRGPAAVAAMETGPPRLSAELAPEKFGVKLGESYSETVGPRVGESYGMEVGAARAPVPRADINAPFEPPWLRDPRQQPIFPQPPVEFTGVEPFAGDPLQAALFEGARGLPTPIAQRIKDEFLGTLGAFKSIKSMGDISAVLRQGAILFLRPFQARQSAKALGRMFQAFRQKNFDAIHEAIATHPDLPAMQEAGLYLGGPSGAVGKGEEAFIKRSGSWVGEKVGKLPGVKQSDQMYVTMLDSQRVQRFQQFKQAIDKLGLSPEEAAKGYKAAAQWVNITTGRGSLGQTIDRTFEALNYAIFSPRFVASRLNVLNPVMYLRNAATPAGRAVLKGQMADLAQFAGVAAATLYAAKQAGADVTLDRKSPDFGKIRLGNYRYDIGAGLGQVIRLFDMVGEDILFRAAQGEKPRGKTAIDMAETFLSYKLSPPAQVFRNFINQRTVDKKPYTVGRAAADLAAPMQWADFVDAWANEGLGGALKTLPGVLGIGVQRYQPDPVNDAIQRAQPLFTELQRLGKQVAPLSKRSKQEFKNGKWVKVDNEPDAEFNARVQQFGQNYTLYGLQLLENPRFIDAPDSVKTLALDELNNRAKRITTAEFAFPEIELDANTLMDSAEATANKRNSAQ